MEFFANMKNEGLESGSVGNLLKKHKELSWNLSTHIKAGHTYCNPKIGRGDRWILRAHCPASLGKNKKLPIQ